MSNDIIPNTPTRGRTSLGQFQKRMTGEHFNGRAVYHDRKGYACIWINNKNVKVHILVWEKAHGPKPEGYDIHHKDENKGNYALGNLELLSASDHQRVHAGWVRKGGEWVEKPCNRCRQILPLSAFYPRKGMTPTALCKPCHNDSVKERLQRPEARERMLEQHRAYYRRRKGAA